MEGNLSSGSTLPSYGGFDLQGPTRVHHHQQQHHQLALHHQHSSKLPLTIGNTLDCDLTVSLTDCNRRKSASDEDEPSFMEDAVDARCDLSKSKKAASPWQRVKWTDTMVRMLITAVSYISEEVAAECMGGGVRRKLSNLQKKGKWKSVSKVMAERGHFVSPQQCEDKFNDLNKRYKRLNEILGRGTSCEVVENPALLDVMDHISEKAKEEVRKILSSKHLHYEEMCSYHNGNRLHLPPDPELQRSLRLALMPTDDDHDDNDPKRLQLHDENDDVEQEAEFDDRDGSEENLDQRSYGLPGSSSKRVKQGQSREDFSFRNSLDCYRTYNIQAETGGAYLNQVPNEGTTKTNMLQKQRSKNPRNLQLEEKRLHIQEQTLELERERLKWQRFCRKKDRELEMIKMEIERMRMENERMALELRRKEMGIENN